VNWSISTNITHGNAAAKDIKKEGNKLIVLFSADPHGGTETLWWCFRIERKKEDDIHIIRLVWKHYYNCLGLNRDNVTMVNPVVRYDDGQWKRLPSPCIQQNPGGSNYAYWEITKPEKYIDVAFCFPHGPNELKDFIYKSKWNSDSIGVSQKGREVIRVSNNYGSDNNKIPGIYCIAHQHASEMSGAWVLQGFLTEIARKGNNAPLVWSIPILNIDGTIEGDYGKDPFPWDINRAWGHLPMRIEVKACMNDISLWQSLCKPLICLDFHSPGACEDDGVYAFIPTVDERKKQLINLFADKIAYFLGKYSANNFKRIASYPSRFKTDLHMNFTKFCCQHNLLALSFEIPYSRIGEKILYIEDYLEIGAKIADAICNFKGEL